MSTLTLSQQRQLSSLTTLANANELAMRIIRKVSGNDVSNRINGSLLNSDLVCIAFQNRYKQALEKPPAR